MICVKGGIRRAVAARYYVLDAETLVATMLMLSSMSMAIVLMGEREH